MDFTGCEGAGMTGLSTTPALPTVALAGEQAGKYPGTCTDWSFAGQFHVEKPMPTQNRRQPHDRKGLVSTPMGFQFSLKSIEFLYFQCLLDWFC